jgi:hypothetical protein
MLLRAQAARGREAAAPPVVAGAGIRSGECTRGTRACRRRRAFGRWTRRRPGRPAQPDGTGVEPSGEGSSGLGDGSSGLGEASSSGGRQFDQRRSEAASRLLDRNDRLVQPALRDVGHDDGQAARRSGQRGAGLLLPGERGTDRGRDAVRRGGRRLVQRTEGGVVVAVATQPLVQRRDVDGVPQLVAQALRVVERRARLGDSRQRRLELALAPDVDRGRDSLVVSGKQRRETGRRAGAGRQACPRNGQEIRRLERVEQLGMPRLGSGREDEVGALAEQGHRRQTAAERGARLPDLANQAAAVVRRSVEQVEIACREGGKGATALQAELIDEPRDRGHVPRRRVEIGADGCVARPRELGASGRARRVIERDGQAGRSEGDRTCDHEPQAGRSKARRREPVAGGPSSRPERSYDRTPSACGSWSRSLCRR